MFLYEHNSFTLPATIKFAGLFCELNSACPNILVPPCHNSRQGNNYREKIAFGTRFMSSWYSYRRGEKKRLYRYRSERQEPGSQRSPNASANYCVNQESETALMFSRCLKMWLLHLMQVNSKSVSVNAMVKNGLILNLSYSALPSKYYGAL